MQLLLLCRLLLLLLLQLLLLQLWPVVEEEKGALQLLQLQLLGAAQQSSSTLRAQPALALMQEEACAWAPLALPVAARAGCLLLRPLHLMAVQPLQCPVAPTLRCSCRLELTPSCSMPAP